MYRSTEGRKTLMQFRCLDFLILYRLSESVLLRSIAFLSTKTGEEPHCSWSNKEFPAMSFKWKYNIHFQMETDLFLPLESWLFWLFMLLIFCRLCLLQLLKLTSVVCTSSEVVLCTLNASLYMHFILIWIVFCSVCSRKITNLIKS